MTDIKDGHWIHCQFNESIVKASGKSGNYGNYGNSGNYGNYGNYGINRNIPIPPIPPIIPRLPRLPINLPVNPGYNLELKILKNFC